jgi:hypothetical protein
MKDLKCPYCGHEFDIDRCDGEGCTEDVLEQKQCPKCEMFFVFNTTIVFIHETHEAACLNGSPHNYVITATYPKECSKMVCTMCDDTRELTDEERKAHNIGSIEAYFDSLKTKKP